MLITTSQIAVFAVAALGLCSNAWSQEPAPSRLPLAFGQPVGIAALEAHRGGDQSVNENRLRATLGDNSASNLTTGTNAISEGSFGQAAGFPMVIQNSGNNVIIQNSTILNLNLK